MRRRAAVVVTLIVALSTLGPTAAQGQDEERSRDWRLGYDAKFDGQINVFKSQLAASYFAFTEVYDTFPYNWRLSDAGPDTENSLVTSHEVSSDGLVYTFHPERASAGTTASRSRPTTWCSPTTPTTT
jgi:hypothetical protein